MSCFQKASGFLEVSPIEFVYSCLLALKSVIAYYVASVLIYGRLIEGAKGGFILRSVSRDWYIYLVNKVGFIFSFSLLIHIKWNEVIVICERRWLMTL